MSSTHTRPWLALSVLVAVAYGCGGQVRPLPDGGEANENGGSNGGSSSSGSPGGSSGSATGSSSGTTSTGSSSGASSTGDTCGGTRCSASEVCCVTATVTGDAASGTEVCTTAAACKGLVLACGDAMDCTGNEKCCVTFDILSAISGGAITGSSSCKATCPTSEGDGQLCATSAECPSGVTCDPIPGMGGSVCGGVTSLFGGL